MFSMVLGVGWGRPSLSTSRKHMRSLCFQWFWWWRSGARHFPPPQHSEETYMFSMVMLVRRGRPSHPPVKNCRNHDVFNDLGGGAGAPATSQVPKKSWKSMCFQWFWRWAGAPVSSHLPKNYRKHHVFNDFCAGVGAPVISHLLKKLLKFVCFQWFWGWGGGAVTCRLPKKLWKSTRFQ